MADGVTPVLAQPGFRCERVTYRSSATDEIASMAACATADPAEAIRSIRADVRRLASTLPPREGARASEANERGVLGALAALHRGEPCGFVLHSRDTWVEWSVQPVLFLPLADSGPATSCRNAGDRPTGLGAPLMPYAHTP